MYIPAKKKNQWLHQPTQKWRGTTLSQTSHANNPTRQTVMIGLRIERKHVSLGINHCVHAIFEFFFFSS